DAGRPALPHGGVGDGRARQGDLEEVLLGLLYALLHGQARLFGLAVAEADPAVGVPDHHQRGEREAPAALHHLGHPVDLDGALLELRLSHFRAPILRVWPPRPRRRPCRGTGSHPCRIRRARSPRRGRAPPPGGPRWWPPPCWRWRRCAAPPPPSTPPPGCGRGRRRSPGR